MSKFDPIPTASSLTFCFLCFRRPIAPRWLCISCVENGTFVPSKFSKIDESNYRNISLSSTALPESSSLIVSSTLLQSTLSCDPALSQLSLSSSLSSSSEQSRDLTLAELSRRVDMIRQEREKLSRKIETELLDKRQRLHTKVAGAERVRRELIVRDLRQKVDTLRRQLVASRERGRKAVRDMREAVKRSSAQKQKADSDVSRSSASLQKSRATFAAKLESLQKRRACLVRQVVDLLQQRFLAPPPAAPDDLSTLPSPVPMHAELRENVGWTQVDATNSDSAILSQFFFEILTLPIDSRDFKHFLAPSVVRGVSEKEGLKLQRKKLRAIIASSIYLQLVLSITRWILEAKPGDSPPQLSGQNWRQDLLCSAEHRRNCSYWLARWWRLERAFLDMALAQRVPLAHVEDESAICIDAKPLLCPSQLGPNLLLLADYPLLGRDISGRAPVERLPPYFHGYFSLRKQLQVLLRLHRASGDLPAEGAGSRLQPDSPKNVSRRADLPEDNDLLDVRVSILSADELRELLQAVQSSERSSELSDSTDSSHLLAPTVGASELCSSAESGNSDRQSGGERHASPREGPALLRTASIGEDWLLPDKADIDEPIGPLPPSAHLPQRSSLAALFVSTSSSLSGTVGHLTNLSSSLYRSSIGGIPAGADEENAERTLQRESSLSDDPPVQSVPPVLPSADTAGKSGEAVAPTSIWNYWIGRRN